ncbi:helix-turn-helix domain-containing protein [Capnocytophaga canimorsus]|uniref:helix-turn-helix domain-containing protein n=1 Tax=Capnocytophaga canimorsus TaxID=28188 RepID=UPI0028F3B1A4|nr:helix-turn-helix domain-containing protein [Capnocytophaga canimorsus]
MPAAKFQIERKCELCGKTFLAKTITSRYCSIQCSRSAYSQKKREKKLEELRREKAAKVPKDQPYLSISDAIALYDVCRDTLYRLVRSKALRSYNLGKRMTRICKEDLERNFNLRPIDEQKPRTRNKAKLYNLEPEYCYTWQDGKQPLRSWMDGMQRKERLYKPLRRKLMRWAKRVALSSVKNMFLVLTLRIVKRLSLFAVWGLLFCFHCLETSGKCDKIVNCRIMT